MSRPSFSPNRFVLGGKDKVTVFGPKSPFIGDKVTVFSKNEFKTV